MQRGGHALPPPPPTVLVGNGNNGIRRVFGAALIKNPHYIMGQKFLLYKKGVHKAHDLYYHLVA